MADPVSKATETLRSVSVKMVKHKTDARIFKLLLLRELISDPGYDPIKKEGFQSTPARQTNENLEC